MMPGQCKEDPSTFYLLPMPMHFFPFLFFLFFPHFLLTMMTSSDSLPVFGLWLSPLCFHTSNKPHGIICNTTGTTCFPMLLHYVRKHTTFCLKWTKQLWDEYNLTVPSSAGGEHGQTDTRRSLQDDQMPVRPQGIHCWVGLSSYLMWPAVAPVRPLLLARLAMQMFHSLTQPSES